MSNIEKLDVNYEGSADETLLKNVIRDLKLNSSITLHSKITINASTHRK